MGPEKQGNGQGMAKRNPFSARLRRWGDAYCARTCGSGVLGDRFERDPDPVTIGTWDAGQRILRREFLFSGHQLSFQNQSPWRMRSPTPRFAQDMHGFTWLGDLAAVANKNAIALAQELVFDWIAQFGRGGGIWSPNIAARRAVRWLHHSALVLHHKPDAERTVFFNALGRHANFLAKRWNKTPIGLPRIEALTGLIYLGLMLTEFEDLIQPATRALAKECNRMVDKNGAVVSRNPQELLETAVQLSWGIAALTDAGWTPSPSHFDALDRCAVTLRGMRHADGSLPRFHGGGTAPAGQLDHVLAMSRKRGVFPDGLAMGFARLQVGRTTAIMDGAPPAKGAASTNAHASALAFEFTSGRRPIVVNCGSGRDFGSDWRGQSRLPSCHSMLTLDGLSFARLARRGKLQTGLIEMPFERDDTSDQYYIQGAHDGYSAQTGLTHVRKIALTTDARSLIGEDLLIATSEHAEKRFARAQKRSPLLCRIRFHLHPECKPKIENAISQVEIKLPNEEVWIFAHNLTAELAVEDSVYFETGQIRPIATKQIVLTYKLIEYASRIRWSFSKTHDTASAVRDVGTTDHHSNFDDRGYS